MVGYFYHVVGLSELAWITWMTGFCWVGEVEILQNINSSPHEHRGLLAAVQNPTLGAGRFFILTYFIIPTKIVMNSFMGVVSRSKVHVPVQCPLRLLGFIIIQKPYLLLLPLNHRKEKTWSTWKYCTPPRGCSNSRSFLQKFVETILCRKQLYATASVVNIAFWAADVHFIRVRHLYGYDWKFARRVWVV